MDNTIKEFGTRIQMEIANILATISMYEKEIITLHTKMKNIDNTILEATNRVKYLEEFLPSAHCAGRAPADAAVGPASAPHTPGYGPGCV